MKGGEGEVAQKSGSADEQGEPDELYFWDGGKDGIGRWRVWAVWRHPYPRVARARTHTFSCFIIMNNRGRVQAPETACSSHSRTSSKSIATLFHLTCTCVRRLHVKGLVYVFPCPPTLQIHLSPLRERRFRTSSTPYTRA